GCWRSSSPEAACSGGPLGRSRGLSSGALGAGRTAIQSAADNLPALLGEDARQGAVEKLPVGGRYRKAEGIIALGHDFAGDLKARAGGKVGKQSAAAVAHGPGALHRFQ